MDVEKKNKKNNNNILAKLKEIACALLLKSVNKINDGVCQDDLNFFFLFNKLVKKMTIYFSLQLLNIPQCHIVFSFPHNSANTI